jgi:hypothetical protein
MSNIFYLQNEKRNFVDVLEAFQKLETPTIYHQLAYRYELDRYINRAAEYYNNLQDMRDDVRDELGKQGLTHQEPLPPVIEARISEILEAYTVDNPNITNEERDDIIAYLFDEGGEFDGLYTEDGHIDKEWLNEYLSYNDNLPDQLTIPFTAEMQDDINKINATVGLEDEEKQEMIDSLFSAGGKYDGYIQLDGTVDESKIIKPKEASAESNML